MSAARVGDTVRVQFGAREFRTGIVVSVSAPGAPWREALYVRFPMPDGRTFFGWYDLSVVTAVSK